MHLANTSGDDSSFRVKVVLPFDEIGIGKQGFNVVLRQPNVTYTTVVYALAVALYEVHEVINAESADGTEGEGDDVESLPPPDTITRPSSDSTLPYSSQNVRDLPEEDFLRQR